MDKTHYYQLLRSVALAALAACGDDECAHEVEVKSSSFMIVPSVACQSVSAVPAVPGGGAYLIRAEACGELCRDPKMNSCDLPSAYMQEFERLNGDAEFNLKGGLADRQCPDVGSQPLALDCARYVTRGHDHDGCPVAGRRPAGLRRVARRGDDRVAAYLARSAHLEAASVLAFQALAAELSLHGAPAALVADCLAAAREEVAHATALGALARARGATPCKATMPRRALPSLVQLAIENEVEGVVRESFGAAQAILSAHHASAPDVRSAMASIAVDEASHAALSSRIASWLSSQLTLEQRRLVASKRRDAIDELRRAIDIEPEGALVVELGVPSRAVSLRLLAGLENGLWSAQGPGDGGPAHLAIAS